MTDRPLCFVLMPFGMKKDPSGGPDIDFDRIYEDAIRPGIEAAGMAPIRADEERIGGIIHQAMFERLLLCDFAVADLTTENANVFYELGIRHAVRPATTLSIFARHQRLPFDIGNLRSLPYELDEGNRFGTREAGLLRSGLSRRLEDLRKIAREDAVADSPVFQLLKDYQAPDIARLKTDVFRDRVRYAADIQRELADARHGRNLEALDEIEQRFEDGLDGVEVGVLVDLFLSYRAVSAWERMILLYERLPVTLRRAVMIREQTALALNRMRRRSEAIEMLETIIQEQGPSSETYGLLGRVYKDMWSEAEKSGNNLLAAGYLDRAINSYVRGFHADWRDAYPGINAVTLLELKGDKDALTSQAELLPVVRFAVSQRLKSVKPDYWDYATMLELAVLEGNRDSAIRWLSDALIAVRESWEPETTANNLTMIRNVRQGRGVEQPWLAEIIDALKMPRPM
jgi:tetratricopeptide (TPR) repeat protein